MEFLKVESIGGMWNTPQLIDMLEKLVQGRFQGAVKLLITLS